MNQWWLVPVQLFIGLAGGIAVGSGMVAFLVVLDIIPRLAQITRSYRYIRAYEWSVIGGSVFLHYQIFRVVLFITSVDSSFARLVGRRVCWHAGRGIDGGNERTADSRQTGRDGLLYAVAADGHGVRKSAGVIAGLAARPGLTNNM